MFQNQSKYFKINHIFGDYISDCTKFCNYDIMTRVMEKKYKIIACDLDETLLNSERKVSAENVEAIQEARNAGVRFVLCTGRGYKSAEGTLKEIGLFKEAGEYVISFNGGAITENSGERLLHFDALDFDVARALVEKAKNYDVCMHAYTKDTVYVYNFVENERAYVAGRMNVVEIDEMSIDFLRGEDIVKVLFMNESEEYRKQMKIDFADIAKSCEVSFSSNRYIEFNKKGVDKGRGLAILAEKLGVDIADTIAIGDNFNDLSMIKAAGLGVGVANSADGIKPYCDYITTRTHDESAIAEVINKFILGL